MQNKKLTEEQRIALIKKGKEAYKQKDLKLAKECFILADYKEGLILLGDYYMYEKRLPLLAYGYYKKAGAKEKIEDLHQRMILALSKWIGEDKIKPESLKKIKQNRKEEFIEVKVDPKLLEKAKEIIEKYESSKENN